MTIGDLPEVVIDPEGGRKFIVAELSDSDGHRRLIVRAHRHCELHRDILEVLRRDIELTGLSARCMGGGRICADSAGKTIQIWSGSGQYGHEPDRAETVRMLQAAFPEHTILF